MEVMLKSTFGMDDWAKDMRQYEEKYGSQHQDYFHWELHVFFDDAMAKKDGKDIVNDFVVTLMRTVDEYGEKYYGDKWKLDLTRLQTPYGGRLIWQLPGGTRNPTKLFASNLYFYYTTQGSQF